MELGAVYERRHSRFELGPLSVRYPTVELFGVWLASCDVPGSLLGSFDEPSGRFVAACPNQHGRPGGFPECSYSSSACDASNPNRAEIGYVLWPGSPMAAAATTNVGRFLDRLAFVARNCPYGEDCKKKGRCGYLLPVRVSRSSPQIPV
jgi:hypothetical protein